MNKQTSTFIPTAIIAKKRDGNKLSKDEIKWFIDQFTTGAIPDYQMSALLMSIYLKGMDKSETAYLTDAMLYSGAVLHFDDATVIDKHSTGGVGDKTSFIVAPIAASYGVKVPMIAGRGLGHTGGTVDKIEAVKGFKTQLGLDEFSKQLQEHHIVLIGQTNEMAPADKKVYALRDVTSTVESIPLITASIMSKKIAEGAAGLVLDIKAGNGAFMKSLKEAKKLAQSLRETGIRFDKRMFTTITDMNQPTGFAIGNSNEIIECIEVLKGRGPKDLIDICLHLSGGMIYLAGKSKTHAKGIQMAKDAIKSGKALEKFRHLLKIQGANPNIVDNYNSLPIAKQTFDVVAKHSGFLSQLKPIPLGNACARLGGGRQKATDVIDHSVGIILHKKLGQKVKKGESLLTIYHHANQSEVVKIITQDLEENCYSISKNKPSTLPKLIYETKISLG